MYDVCRTEGVGFYYLTKEAFYGHMAHKEHLLQNPQHAHEILRRNLQGKNLQDMSVEAFLAARFPNIGQRKCLIEFAPKKRVTITQAEHIHKCEKILNSWFNEKAIADQHLLKRGELRKQYNELKKQIVESLIEAGNKNNQADLTSTHATQLVEKLSTIKDKDKKNYLISSIQNDIDSFKPQSVADKCKSAVASFMRFFRR